MLHTRNDDVPDLGRHPLVPWIRDSNFLDDPIRIRLLLGRELEALLGRQGHEDAVRIRLVAPEVAVAVEDVAGLAANPAIRRFRRPSSSGEALSSANAFDAVVV